MTKKVPANGVRLLWGGPKYYKYTRLGLQWQSQLRVPFLLPVSAPSVLGALLVCSFIDSQGLISLFQLGALPAVNVG